MELNKIYNEDCLETMAKMPNGFCDLIITSPPYNVGKNNMTDNKKYKEHNDSMSQEEYLEWTRKILNECLRVAETTFYNIQMLSDNKRNVLAILGEYKDKIKDIIIWNKNSAAPAIEPGVLTSKFEFIIIFSNDNPEKRKFKKGNFHGNFTNVLEGNSATGNKFSDIHKATFPLYLPSKIITNFSKEGDLIYDPFMGIGTTAVASQSLKRNWIGSEISSEYIENANEYIKSTSNTLF